jgi:hypothetical protein
MVEDPWRIDDVSIECEYRRGAPVGSNGVACGIV